jgi:hypothetical protein
VNDDRPWEQPGAVRRDCEPHRGPALRLLGWAGVTLMAGGLPLGCCGTVLLGPVPLPGGLAGPALLFLLPALALTSGVAWAARRDLAGMREGLRDPAGRRETQAAKWLGDVGLVLGLLGGVLGSVVIIINESLKCRL